MNFKQKCFYMGLGCVFTLLGYTLATLNTNVTAQTAPSNATFGKITCRELVITNEEGDGEIRLFPGDLWIKGPERTVVIGDLFGVRVVETGGKSEVGLSTLPSGGAMWVKDKKGTIVSSIGVNDEGGGRIQLYDQHAKSAIQLAFDENGGYIAIFNKGKQNVLQAGVNEQGYGVITTQDKNGYRTGSLP